VTIVVGGGLVVVVLLGGTVVGGVLIGSVVEVVGTGSVVVVGGLCRTGIVVVVVGLRRAGRVEVVAGRVVLVGVADGLWWVPGRDDDAPVCPGADACLFGWGWEAVDAPTVSTGRRVDSLATAVSDRDDHVEALVSARRSAGSALITGTPASVARSGISGRVAPT
jgi:hypothetical protein